MSVILRSKTPCYTNAFSTLFISLHTLAEPRSSPQDVYIESVTNLHNCLQDFVETFL